jgi:hypothetical protein
MDQVELAHYRWVEKEVDTILKSNSGNTVYSVRTMRENAVKGRLRVVYDYRLGVCLDAVYG